MNFSLLLIIVVVGALLYVVSVYNDLVALKTRIKASIQEIGNQLKRQAELIPNLEESAKGYLQHEKGLFKLLTDARKSVQAAVTSGDLGQLSSAAAKVADLLPKIQVVVESNPQIQASGIVTKLMDELRDTSDKVMYSRRTLIDLTADYNVKLVSFPSNLVANLFSFQAEKGLEAPDTGPHLAVSSAEVQTPQVKL